jgi:hypothetical protein
MKRIEKDGKFFRMRRGKLVEIPAEWVGKTVHPQETRGRKVDAINAHDAVHHGRSATIQAVLADTAGSPKEGMAPKANRTWKYGRKERDRHCDECKGVGKVQAGHEFQTPYATDYITCPKCKGVTVNTKGERKQAKRT